MIDHKGLERIKDSNELEEDIARIFSTVIENNATPSSISEAITAMFNSDIIPDDFRHNLLDKELQQDLEQELKTLIFDLANSSEFEHLSNQELANIFSRKFFFLLASHHAAGVAISFPSKVIPEVQNPPNFRSHKEMLVEGTVKLPARLQYIGGMLFLGLSGYTSYEGGKNLFAATISPNLIEPYATLSPDAQIAFNQFFGAISAFLISFWALRKFKSEVINNAINNGKGLVQNIKDYSASDKDLIGFRAAKKQYALNVLSISMAMFMFYDVYSNVNGVINITAGSADKISQLNQIKAEIKHATELLDETAGQLPEDYYKEAQKYVQKELSSELSGTSASGKGGAGSMYYAKVIGLQDSSNKAAAEYFNSQKASKTREFTWSLIKSQDVVEDQFKGYPEELRQRVKKHTDIVIEKNKAVRSTLNSIEADEETEKINEKLSQIQKIIEDSTKILSLEKGTSSKQEVENVISKYNQFSSSLLAIPVKFPSIYPDYKATKIEPISTTKVKIPDLTFEVPDVDYKTVEDLLAEYIAQDEKMKGSLMVFLAIILALFASHGDMIFYPTLKRRTQEDKTKIKNQTETIYEPIKRGLYSILTQVINTTYSEVLFGEGLEVPEKYIMEVIEEYLEEQRAYYDQNMSFYKATILKLQKTNSANYFKDNFTETNMESTASKRFRETGETDPVVNYNRNMLILMNIISSPSQIQSIVSKILQSYTSDNMIKSAGSIKEQAASEVKNRMIKRLRFKLGTIIIPEPSIKSSVDNLKSQVEKATQDIEFLRIYSEVAPQDLQEESTELIHKLQSSVDTAVDYIERKKQENAVKETNRVILQKEQVQIDLSKKFKRSFDSYLLAKKRQGSKKNIIDSFLDVLQLQHIAISAQNEYIPPLQEDMQESLQKIIKQFNIWENLEIFSSDISISLQQKLQEEYEYILQQINLLTNNNG